MAQPVAARTPPVVEATEGATGTRRRDTAPATDRRHRPAWRRRIHPVLARRLGWAVLTLFFCVSAGMHFLLTVTTSASWPLPTAAVETLLAGCCATAAVRQR